MQQEVAPNPAGVLPQARRSASAGHAAVTFLLCAVLFTVTLVSVGAVTRVVEIFRPVPNSQLVTMLLNVLVLLAGLLVIARVRVTGLRALSAIGVVRRPTAGREAGVGAAIGWAVGVALVLPGVLALRMHSTISADGFHLGAAAASGMVLLLFVVARQLLLCGLPFQSLAQATSPLFASVAFAGMAALLTIVGTRGGAAEALLAAMAQLVFCMAAARTRAIWLGTALQLLWGLTVTLLFGLPSFLWPPATGIVESSMSGPRWLTGNRFGPEAALWAGLVILAALIVVWRLTRDYAWHYTFDPIVGAGYAMDVPPPAEHVRMEQVSQAAPLVQIGGVVSAPVEPPPVQDHPSQKL